MDRQSPLFWPPAPVFGIC